jgi:hypothetical protein
MKSPVPVKLTFVTCAAAFAPVPEFVRVTIGWEKKLVFCPTVVSLNIGLPKIALLSWGPPLVAPMPVTVVEAGVVSLSASVIVAVRFPGAAGVNTKFTKQMPCGGNVKAGPQLPVLITNSEASAPVILNPVTLRVPPPVLCTKSVWIGPA